MLDMEFTYSMLKSANELYRSTKYKVGGWVLLSCAVRVEGAVIVQNFFFWKENLLNMKVSNIKAHTPSIKTK